MLLFCVIFGALTLGPEDGPATQQCVVPEEQV